MEKKKKPLRIPASLEGFKLGVFIQIISLYVLKSRDELEKDSIQRVFVDAQVASKCISYLEKNAPKMQSFKIDSNYGIITCEVKATSLPEYKFTVYPERSHTECCQLFKPTDEEIFWFNPFNILYSYN